MRIFRQKTRSRWLHAWVVGLTLAFALSSLGHALHNHDGDSGGRTLSEVALCGLCLSFDRIVDGPAATPFVVTAANRLNHVVGPEAVIPTTRPTLRFVPRGPPVV